MHILLVFLLLVLLFELEVQNLGTCARANAYTSAGYTSVNLRRGSAGFAMGSPP
jgi:hypothetical protein